MEYKPYKPFLSWLRELYISFCLRVAGYGREMAGSVIGYSPADVSFVYGTSPKNCNENTLISELWMGSTLSCDQLAGVWDDQIPEVIVQWWGSTPVKDGISGTRKITRLEVHHLQDGSFVQHSYKNVSEMGAFDGSLESLSLYTPEPDFYHSDKPRKFFNIHKIHCVWGWWTVNMKRSNFFGTSMLNAWSQIKEFRIDSLSLIKSDSK